MFLALIIKFSNQPPERRTQSHIIETYVHLKLELNICICVCVCVRTGYVSAYRVCRAAVADSTSKRTLSAYLV